MRLDPPPNPILKNKILDQQLLVRVDGQQCSAPKTHPPSSKIYTWISSFLCGWPDSVHSSSTAAAKRAAGLAWLSASVAALRTMIALAITAAAADCHLGDIAETDGIPLVLFGMQNGTLGPYLAANNRIHLVLFGMQNGTIRSLFGSQPQNHCSRP
jgi:hypothetical protein